MKTKTKKADAKDIYGEHLLPEGISLNKIREFYNETERTYIPILKRMRILDGTDRGKLWEVVKAKFPRFQILPDTNHVNMIKEELVASLYTTGRYPTLLPKSPDDVQVITEINSAMEAIWDSVDAYNYQLEAGERAALLNLGITQVGWRSDIMGGTSGAWYKGDVVYKNIDPMQFRRDPYADNLDASRFVYVYNDYSLNFIKTNKDYKERLDEILKVKKEIEPVLLSDTITKAGDRPRPNTDPNSEYHRVFTYFIRDLEGEGIHEIHVLDNEYVLKVKKNIKPNQYPFALLYCNLPAGDLVGTSEAAKIFANSLTYNMISSIQATHAYKAQRPTRFISTDAGINLREFQKYGNDADRLFPVTGNASEAYHEAKVQPLSPELPLAKQNLAFDIVDITGVDATYRGKDTGSVQKTGAMDSMITRATQRDLSKIRNYEKYSKDLAILTINNLIEFGDKRSYTVKDPISQEAKKIEIAFPKLGNDFRAAYSINIEPYLPKNKARLASIGNMLLEKQAQYQPDPEIITIEEWLLTQDIPFSDLMFKRIGIQRNTMFTEQVAKTLTMYSDLVSEGMDANEAVEQVALALQEEQVPAMLGNTAGSPQAAQAGGEISEIM